MPQPAQLPGSSAAAPSQLPRMFGGLAGALTPEMHKQLQQQAAEHAQRIQAGLAQPDALRMASSFGAAPAFAGAQQQQPGTLQQPRPQWTPQPAGPPRPARSMFCRSWLVNPTKQECGLAVSRLAHTVDWI